jgi:spermidine/putrescine transport system permease protein
MRFHIVRRRPLAPLDYAKRFSLKLWFGLVLGFLYLPILIMMIFSFNESKRNVVWTHFTTYWYCASSSAPNYDAVHPPLCQDSALLAAFGNSLTIALISTLVALILGTLAAVALWRFTFTGKFLFESAMTLPIVVPEICMGVAMLVFFSKIWVWPADMLWPFSLGAIIIAHISFSFPFVAVVVRARLASFNREEEEAARDLGASELRAFWDVLIPHLKPALISGALLAFTLSLDDFVITFFTAGPDTITFPVKVYSMVRFSVTPEVNAISTLLILITVILTTIGLRLQGEETIGHS